MKTFYEHFKFSLDSLGLPTPNSLFKSVVVATATIKTLCEVVEKFGTKVTFREVLATVPAGYFSTALLFEATSVLINLTVAFYAGACIGALAYATGQYTSERMFSYNNLNYNQLINNCYRYGINVPQELKTYISCDFRRNAKILVA